MILMLYISLRSLTYTLPHIFTIRPEWSTSRFDPRNCWRQLSYAIKNQLGHPKPPSKGFGAQNTSIGEYLNTQLLLGGLQPGLHSVYCGLSRVPTWGLISVHPGLRLVPPTNTLEDKLVEIQFQRGRGEVKLREGVAYCLQRKVVVVGGWYGGDY